MTRSTQMLILLVTLPSAATAAVGIVGPRGDPFQNGNNPRTLADQFL